MQSSLPVIFILTGAWHIPQHYQLLSNRLRHHGYTVQCPLLLTNNNARPPNKTLDDDVRLIREMAVECLDAGRDVVALMHSYGGVVGSNAFSELGIAHRKHGGHIRALIYMTAFLTMERESLIDIFGRQLPPFLSLNPGGWIDIKDPAYCFYHDLPLEEQKKCTEMLVDHPIVAQYDALKSPPSSSAWRTIPVVYILCSDDQAIPVEVQAMMIDRVEREQHGLKICREYVSASHSPFISTPNEIIAIVERVCKADQNERLAVGESQTLDNAS